MRVALLTENRHDLRTAALAHHLRRYADVDVLRAGTAPTRDLAGVDVVHSHTWDTGLAGHLAKFQHGVPHVLTPPGLEPPARTRRGALLVADRIVVGSFQMRAELMRRHRELAPRRVTVVHGGFDTQAYHPDEGTGALAALGVRTDPAAVRHTVACVGRDLPEAALLNLLRAAPRLLPGTQVVICASGPEVERAHGELADALRAEGCDLVWVRRTPSPRAVRQLLTFADVSVCPAGHDAPEPAALAAMACGTPVVATKAGCLTEVVHDGVTGLLVPPPAAHPEIYAKDLADGINSLLADPQKAAWMGETGLARTEREFTFEAAAERLYAVYEAVSENKVKAQRMKTEPIRT
ncbi:glycosyltransferase family 4 protein [Streptomyces sp. NPDC001340]